MEPKFVTKEAFSLVGMMYSGKPQGDDIPQLWRAFGARMGEVAGVVSPGDCYGATHSYDMDTGEMEYVAAMEVPADAPVPDGMVRVDVPAQTYAVFPCTLPAIQATFGQIYSEWLPASGYQRAPGSEFELYDGAFDPNDPASIFYAYIPVVKG
jgi:AraC family transcriptional regulator